MTDKKNISINIESSKSLFNRALICGSFSDNFQIDGLSSADDVTYLQKCLDQFKNKTSGDYFCGSGGTTFRFFLLRASRAPGEYLIQGSERLFERPQSEFIHLGQRLGFSVEIGKGARLKTVGWKNPNKPLEVSQSLSSQFISSVLLNSWDLDFDLTIKTHSGKASDSYLQMTLEFMKDLGFKYEKSGSEIFIPHSQKVQKNHLVIEPDMSSSFFVAALASPHRNILIQNFPMNSLQPDFRFTEILEKMNYQIERNGNALKISKPSTIQSISLDLEGTLDLFPVLAVLCSRANGVSELRGLRNLAHKESHRLQRIAELLEKLNIKFDMTDDLLRVTGSPQSYPQHSLVNLNPDHDHRLVMAGIIAKNLGADINLLDLNPIRKSFPQFFDLQKELGL